MSGRLLISTRKGLFEIARGTRGYRIADVAFLGANVSLALPADGAGCELVALDHGHFGAKLQRRRGDGAFEEAPRPQFPPRADGTPEDTTADGKPLPWN